MNNSKLSIHNSSFVSKSASLKDLGKKWFAFSLIEEDVFELKKRIGEVLDD